MKKYWLINGKHGQGTHSSTMGVDKLAESTPNAPKCICPNCLPKPKSLGFDEKWLHWASVSSINVETDQEFQLEFLAALNEREKK